MVPWIIAGAISVLVIAGATTLLAIIVRALADVEIEQDEVEDDATWIGEYAPIAAPVI